jgi:hypothetical protein
VQAIVLGGRRIQLEAAVLNLLDRIQLNKETDGNRNVIPA